MLEGTRLACADREAWYGDPDFSDIPLAALLDDAYAEERPASPSTTTGASSPSARRAATSRTSGRSCSLRHVHAGLGLQAAIDEPALHSEHMPGSFCPRRARPRGVPIEARYAPATVAALRDRGHDILLGDDWSLGRISAASAGAGDGWLRAAANSRGMQGYACAR